LTRSLLKAVCLLGAWTASMTFAACPLPPVIVRDAGPDAPIDDVIAAEEYCETIVDFFCAYYVRCGRMAVESETECRGVFLEACNARYEPSYIAIADASLLSLSRNGVETCATHLDEVACEEQILDLDGPCAGMWIGTQESGAACGFDIESFVCVTGTACELGPDFCGTCESIAPDGERCDADGVTCSRASSCEGGVCVAKKRVGEACVAGERCMLGASCNNGFCSGAAYVSVGDACDFSHRCPYRSECINGACVLAGGLGASCSDVVPCDSGVHCEADQCVELRAQGAACTSSAECQPGLCRDGFCDVLPSACIP